MKYFVIGLTNEDVVGGAQFSLLNLSNIAMRKAQTIEAQVARLKQAGAFDHYEVRKPVMDIRSVSVVEESAHRQLTEMVGEEYFDFVLLNETAKAVAEAHGVKMPPVLLVLDEKQLPSGTGRLLTMPYTELVQA